MQWLLAVVLAVLGSAIGGIGVAAVGFCAGALIGWLLGNAQHLRAELRRVEQDVERLRVEQAAMAVRQTAPAEPAAAAPAATPPPTCADATAAARATPAPVVRAPVDVVPVVPDAPFAAGPLDEVTTSLGASSADETADTPAPSPAPVNRARFDTPATAQPTIDAAESRLESPAWPSPPAGAPPHRPASPRAARRDDDTPDLGTRMGETLRRWFTEGNVPVKIGVIVFLFGIGAALKYVADQGWLTFPIEYRLIGIAVAALVGLVIGWRERVRRRAFALAIQGGAIGVLLLTVFAAFGLYKVLPAGAAFAFVMVLVAGASLLAVLQDAPALAALGFFGGYLAPVLIRTGSNDHVALFSYYGVLNAAVFAIALVKSWRALNLIGFAFTFVVGLGWGAQYYEPRHFATVEPFLVAFFLFYVGIAVLYALRQPDDRRGLVDGTITFGTPLLAFPLQAAMLKDDPIALAYSALAVAALYGTLAWWLIRRRGIVVLGQAFGVLAVGFATLAVPLALSARMTASTWAIEGAALVWLGLRQQRLLPRITGVLLQIGAAMAYVAGVAKHGWEREVAELAILNGHVLAMVMIALAGFATSWLYDRASGRRAVVWLAFGWGWFWWTMAGLREIVVNEAVIDAPTSALAFIAITAALAGLARQLMRWEPPSVMVIATAIAGIPMAMWLVARFNHPFGDHAAWAWLAWTIAMLDGLRRLREPLARGVSGAHVAFLATIALVGGLEGAWRAHHVGALGSAWVLLAAVAPLALLLYGTRRHERIVAWPLADHFPFYRTRFEVPAMAVLAVAWLASLFDPGNTAPLPYLPVINPLELAQIAGLVVLARLALPEGDTARALRNVVPFAALVLATMMTLRGVHHLAQVPWTIDILDSFVAQTALTVVWAIIGVGAWIYGSKRRRRGVWRAGAIIIGIVLVKLVLVDRSYIGNLAGIVSFLAVGLLMIAVGYFAPSPPRDAEATS